MLFIPSIPTIGLSLNYQIAFDIHILGVPNFLNTFSKHNRFAFYHMSSHFTLKHTIKGMRNHGNKTSRNHKTIDEKKICLHANYTIRGLNDTFIVEKHKEIFLFKLSSCPYT